MSRRRNLWAAHVVDPALAASVSRGEAASRVAERTNAQRDDDARAFRDEFGFESGSCDAAGNFNESPKCCAACRAAWVDTAAHRPCPAPCLV